MRALLTCGALLFLSVGLGGCSYDDHDHPNYRRGRYRLDDHYDRGHHRRHDYHRHGYYRRHRDYDYHDYRGHRGGYHHDYRGGYRHDGYGRGRWRDGH